MTYEDFVPVRQVKVDGTLVLERVFSTPQLDFFLMLSSAANILGTGGQANYNAGNAVQDALAHSNRERFVSLNIGWVGDAGHTADNNVREQGLRRAGFKAILPDELLRYFDHVLQAASSDQTLPSQAIIGFDTASLSDATTANGNVRSAMFCHVRELPSSVGFSSSAPDSISHAISSLSHDAVTDTISRAIKEQLARLITVKAERIDDRHGSILDLGLDSLVSIELRNWIMREFDAPLQSTEIMTDQTIHDLAEKVAARSHKILSGSGSSDEKDSDSDSAGPNHGSLTSPSSTSLNTGNVTATLEPVPLPRLEDTLNLFEQSRVAIDSADDQRATAEAVSAFLKKPGPELQQHLEEAGPNTIAEAYERQIYLERREPLQDYSEFFTGHPVDAPAHSQVMRATILTVAAIEFARRWASGGLAKDTFHDVPLTDEARAWLFYATRRPGAGIDSMARFPPNQMVTILRRGHIFQLQLPEPELPLQFSSVYSAYKNILEVSTESLPSVCTLTADERNTWAQVSPSLFSPSSSVRSC